MDVKISCGSGKRGRCPKCGKKYLSIFKSGVSKLVCSCGWEQVVSKYPKNDINLENISQS